MKTGTPDSAVRRATLAIAVASSLTLAAASAWAASPKQHNETGLPTYPHDGGGTMDSVVRSIPNGQHCTHYSSSTPDALATVIDWYKKALPAATAEDVNKDSLYGRYFKLDGVKLLAGHDIVNVYRQGQDPSTSIEIFKCIDAAPPKHD